MKKAFAVLGFLVTFGLGALLMHYYYSSTKIKAEEQSQVLLERIQAVSKLVTVEGYFSEVYNYKEYWGYDFSPFRKKALIRVKAKVSVGYDLNQMKLEARPEEKLLIISNLPEPEIISIDHDIDYYDVTQGTFNTFTAADYNKLNRNAKKYVEERAQESDLMQAAERQGDQILDLIRFMAENSGWQIEVKQNSYLDILNGLN